MAYVITEPCIGTKDSACVDVCPVDCIHPAQGRAGLRVGEDAEHPSRRVHRLRRLRAGLPGGSDFRARRSAGQVEGLHPAEHRRTSRSEPSDCARAEGPVATALPRFRPRAGRGFARPRRSRSARRTSPSSRASTSGVARRGRSDLPSALATAEPARRGDADAPQGHATRFSAGCRRPRRTSSALPAASPWARAPSRASCGRCSRAGRRTRASTSSRPTAFCCRTACSKSAAPRAQGLSRELRPAPPGRVHGRGEGGRRRRARAGVLASGVRHRLRRVSGRRSSRHRDRRRAQRAADRRRRRPGRPAQRAFVSDFFDFSIYLDADERDIERWYIARFLTLRETVFRDPRSYFHRYAGLGRRAGGRHGARHLADDQRRQPAGEHQADARTRATCAGEGRRSRGRRASG